MSYTPPAVTAAGLSIPTYTDILDLLIADFQSTYGQIVALGNDSPDYQWVSSLSSMVADTEKLGQLAYLNRSPITAIGAALDSLVKLNGLNRLQASFSTANLTVTGTSGTTINNGQAQDINGNIWDLPTPVVIPPSGSISVQAICETSGSVTAQVGQISIIFTPVAGWITVTNPLAASVGQPIESDAQLRARQALSVALPSQTILSGTVAAIAGVEGVTRYNILENPTGAPDIFGNPPHSITAVVEGGLDNDIANAIYNNRGIGPFTNGTTTVNITDPVTLITTPISFDRPNPVVVWVIVNIHLLPGGTSALQQAVQNAIVTYLNSLQIGANVNYASLIAAAMSVNPLPLSPVVRVETLYLGTAPSPGGITDIPLNFNAVASGVAANITVNLI